MSKKYTVTIPEELVADAGYVLHYLTEIRAYDSSAYNKMKIGLDNHRLHVSRAVELAEKVFNKLKLEIKKQEVK